MAPPIVFTLLFFAAIGCGGAGAALAVSRARAFSEGEPDIGMWAVSALLLTFGAACALVAFGLAAVIAFGGVAVWYAYVFAAQRLGVFRIERWQASDNQEHTLDVNSR